MCTYCDTLGGDALHCAATPRRIADNGNPRQGSDRSVGQLAYVECSAESTVQRVSEKSTQVVFRNALCVPAMKQPRNSDRASASFGRTTVPELQRAGRVPDVGQGRAPVARISSDAAGGAFEVPAVPA